MAEVTLFIEDSAIRLLVAKGRRVTRWAQMPLEPGLVSDGLILDEAEVAVKIRELLKLQKVSDRTVVAGLSGFNSVYRLLSLPQLPPEILPEAVEQEAGRVVPVPIDQVYLSYQTLPAPAGDTRVFLAAFPRNTTDALLRTLQKAGLRASVLDLAPLALCRTVDAPEAVVVDVRSSSLDIAVMVDRVPQVIRSLSIPGEEAHSLAERLPSIIEEVGRTITFYNSSHRDKPLAETMPIFVSGDLVAAPDAWQSLGGPAGYPVSALESPMEPFEGFDASQFTVNIGLALKQLPLEKEEANFSIVNFNALPQAEKPKKKMSPISILVPIVIVLGIGAVFYLYNMVRNDDARNDLVRSQLELIQLQIPQQQEAIAALMGEIEEIEPLVEPVEAEASAFNTMYSTIVQGRNQIDQDLTQTVHLTSEEVALIYGGDEIVGYSSPISEARIEHIGDRVMVVGESQEVDAIFQYAKDLRSSGRFSQVIISSIEAYEEIVTSETEENEGEAEEEIFKGYNFQFTLIP
jgi:type IV pilus assembly protein PilM